MEHFTKSTELMIHLKFGLGKIVRLQVCPIDHGKLRNCRLKTSHHY